MAAAYRAIERVHAPLTHPLVDMNPSIAHKKLYWSSSFQKMQEDMVANSSRDYSDIKTHYPRRRDVDDLIVLNVYTTNSPTPVWGLGPSPLSPLYLHYPAPHPADTTLPQPPTPKVSALQSISTNYAGRPPHAAPDRPSMLQYFLDRKDFTTRQSTTTTCVRFLEEYAEWRLIFGPAEDAGDSDVVLAAEKTLLQKLGLKACAAEVTRALGEDSIAARIYAAPRVRAVNKSRLSSTTPDHRSVVAPSPLYMSGQEISGDPGVILHYSKSADRRRKYWWIWEDSSWSCVYDPDGTTEWREGYHGSGESAARRRERDLAEAEAQGYASAGVDDSKRSSTASGSDELNCTVIKLYNSDYPEPVAAIELGAGQMWIQKTILLETIDVAVAVIFAIVNMERAVRNERTARAANGRQGFLKRHFSL